MSLQSSSSSRRADSLLPGIRRYAVKKLRDPIIDINTAVYIGKPVPFGSRLPHTSSSLLSLQINLKYISRLTTKNDHPAFRQYNRVIVACL